MATIHEVAHGDTLWGIAQAHGVDMWALMQANPALFDPDVNPYANPDRIMPGWCLFVPTPEHVEPTPEPAPAPAPVERIIEVDYTDASEINGVTTAQLRPFWSGDIDRFNGTADDWHGVQLRDGHTRHWHRGGRKGPGIEVKAHTNAQPERVSARWTMLLEDGFTFGGKQSGGKLGGVALGAGEAHGGSGPVEGSGSVRLNWRTLDGELSIYAYHLDQSGDYGDHTLTGARMPVGGLVELGLDVDVPAGRVIAFMNGDPIWDTGPGFYHWTPGIGVSEFVQVVRFGGSSHDFGPVDTCYSRFYRGHVDAVERVG